MDSPQANRTETLSGEIRNAMRNTRPGGAEVLADTRAPALRCLATAGIVAVGLIFFLVAPPAQAQQQFGFLAKWGMEGSGEGQFARPRSIATDAAGNVYLADGGNYRIQKFTANDRFLTKWGSRGAGDGKFRSPRGIATDVAGNVYVVDLRNNRIQKFGPGGAPVNGETALPRTSAASARKLNRKRGTARLIVRVPGPGRVVLRRTKRVRRAVRKVGAAGRAPTRAVLRVRPRGKAQRRISSRRCETTGKKRLWVRVRARVTYRPTGGTLRTRQRTVRLVRRC